MLLFCEISTVPLVFVDYMHVNPKFYGFYILPVFGIYVLANMVSNKLANTLDVDILLKIGLFSILLSNALVLAIYPFGVTPVLLMGVKSLTYVGWGFVFGNATAQIVSAVSGKAGMASALMIALEMLFSGIGISFVGLFFNGTLMPLSIFMSSIALLGLIVMRDLSRVPS